MRFDVKGSLFGGVVVGLVVVVGLELVFMGFLVNCVEVLGGLFEGVVRMFGFWVMVMLGKVLFVIWVSFVEFEIGCWIVEVFFFKLGRKRWGEVSGRVKIKFYV